MDWVLCCTLSVFMDWVLYCTLPVWMDWALSLITPSLYERTESSLPVWMDWVLSLMHPPCMNGLSPLKLWVTINLHPWTCFLGYFGHDKKLTKSNKTNTRWPCIKYENWTGEMAQLEKWLPHKHEDLSLILKPPHSRSRELTPPRCALTFTHTHVPFHTHTQINTYNKNRI